MTLPKTSLFGFRGDGGALIAGAVFFKMRRIRNRFKNSLIIKHNNSIWLLEYINILMINMINFNFTTTLAKDQYTPIYGVLWYPTWGVLILYE